MLRRNMNTSGYTLIEMLIVLGITTLISLPLGTFYIKGIKGYAYLEAQSQTSTELSTLSQRVVKVIRGTTGILDAQPNTLTIYGYFSPQDTVIKKIRYFVSGSNLSIGVTPPSGTAPNYTYPAANEVITVTRVDLAMGSNTLFSYYDDVGNVLSGAYTVGQIKQIGFYVAANANSKQINVPISIQTRVTLRNFKTNL